VVKVDVVSVEGRRGGNVVGRTIEGGSAIPFKGTSGRNLTSAEGGFAIYGQRADGGAVARGGLRYFRARQRG